MKINKLIINGFKSFGEKTEIIFDENLIGIVGPNGSGKSNIIDAIKWVLGQQKMVELRTKSNTDVIFSGSDDRSAKNVAEVTLIFDNQDRYLDIEYQEVAITRRLFRSGENEYYINKNRCRLLDINNLILDKGFGKDSFSIISQGKVDEIIMSKAEDRRNIIDEVAGISKYKYKKKKTLNKLMIVNENLDKINFILEEIKTRINPLQKEAQKAKKYKEIKVKLEESEKALLANKIYNNSENLEQLNENLIKLGQEIEKKNKKLKEEEENIRYLDNLIKQNQERIGVLNEEISENKNEQMKYSNEIKLLAQKKDLKTNNNTKDLINSVRDRLKNLKQEESNLEHKKLKLEPLTKTSKEKILKTKENIFVIQSKISDFTRQKEEIESQDKDRKIPYHIQKVLDLKNEQVLGTLRQNIQVYSKYEMAINTILGGRQNEIIIQNDKAANEIIKYLKNNKLGKVTFSPLNTIKPRYLPQDIKEKIDTSHLELKVAQDCIKFDPKLAKVISVHLGNIIIAKNLKEGQEAYKLLNQKYQIVTLEGEVLLASGKIIGGYDKKNNAIGLQKKKEEIKVNIKELILEKDIITKQLEKDIFENSEDKIQLEVISHKLKEIKEEKNLVEIEYDELLGNSDNLEESNIYKIEEKIKKIEEKILKYTKEKNQKEEEIKVSLLKKEQKNEDNLDANANFKMLIKEETETKMKIEHFKIETKELIENLREKYSISFQKAYEESLKINDLEEEEKKVKALKNEIKNLGFVNLKAIEEYEEQKKRLDFYENNKADLRMSKEKINNIIQKIDDFVVQVFSDTFVKLNEEFRTIFRQLFEGGEATLNLTDEEDILNTGVEIIAKPPGKKSQIIGLLSGGEKALTAIALLFAILKIRVVPFSILDEVEAALDEANVVKYIEYLKIFSKNTQFILITHRQTTMEKIDKLYGVTMVQKGISTVLDIKLKKENENV